MTIRKILIAFIFILIIAIVGLLLYNMLYKKGEEEAFFPEGDEEEITPTPKEKIALIGAEKAMAPAVSSDKNGLIYYTQANGNVWKSGFDGTDLAQVSSTVIEGLIKIIWSPTKDKVISIYQDTEGNISKYFYSYGTGKATPLSGYIQSIAWSPLGDKIAYQYYNPYSGVNNISIANPDGTIWKNIFNTRMQNLIVEWPGSEISLRTRPSGLAQSSLYLLNPVSKIFNKVLSEIYGMSVKWSFQGDKILYSATDSQGKNISLHFIKKDGTGEKNLNTATLVEKCAWSQDNRTIFCAIPQEIPSLVVLPDDFYKGTFSSTDTFWKINLDTGEKTLLIEPEEKCDATELFLSPQEDYLFFINKKDNLLYGIEL